MDKVILFPDKKSVMVLPCVMRQSSCGSGQDVTWESDYEAGSVHQWLSQENVAKIKRKEKKKLT